MLHIQMIEESGYKTFIYSVHYDNINNLPDKIDSSGFRFFYTEELREFDAGVIQIGDPLLTLGTQKLPAAPGVPGTAGKWDFKCPTSCFNKYLTDQSTFTVFAEVLHMHESGSKMVSSHYRGDSLIRESYVDHYDFNIAGSYAVIQEPFAVEAGDRFTTTCYYQSDKEVKFGLASDEEMCINFIMYYPVMPDFNGYCGIQGKSKLGVRMDSCEVDVTYNVIEEGEIYRTFGSPCDGNPSPKVTSGPSSTPSSKVTLAPSPISTTGTSAPRPEECRGFCIILKIIEEFPSNIPTIYDELFG